MAKLNKHNIPFLLTGILALLSALAGGLLRAGWQLPVVNVNWSLLHGPLMVGGFLGIVIGLERAVALNKTWSYLAPFNAALGVISLWITSLNFLAPWLILFASIFLVMIFIQFQRIKNSFDILLMTVAAGIWTISNVLWISGWSYDLLAIWWIAFLLLTITAERIQLSGLGQQRASVNSGYYLGLGFIVTALVFSFIFPYLMWYLLAGGIIIFAVWLLKYDIARRTIRHKGLTKFVAVCLLGGYLWLLLAGILIFFEKPAAGGLIYDAVLHSIFVGFVFSMIFGHAPIIFPAIIGRPINFHARFYIHLIIMHLSLLFRVMADISGWLEGRSWASLFNVLAILLFLANTVSSILRNTIKTKSLS